MRSAELTAKNVMRICRAKKIRNRATLIEVSDLEAEFLRLGFFA